MKGAVKRVGLVHPACCLHRSWELLSSDYPLQAQIRRRPPHSSSPTTACPLQRLLSTLDNLAALGDHRPHRVQGPGPEIWADRAGNRFRDLR